MVTPGVPAFALGLVLAVAPIPPAARADEEIAVQCRFSSGLPAIYLFSRGDARVRRVDLHQPRSGRVEVTAAEYRFIFREQGSAYRIDVIIDRATGNTRRVFGTRENMERIQGPDDGGSRLVYEAGQCDAQFAELR